MHPQVAKVLRNTKTLLLLLPLLLLLILICVSVSLNDPSEGPSVTQRPLKPNKPVSVTFRMKIERMRLCHSNTTLNETVRQVCEVVAQDQLDYYRPRDTIVNPFNHTFRIDGRHLCKQTTDVVILVHSLHTYTERRAAIRHTWGGAAVTGVWPWASSFPFNVILAFVLGLNHNSSLDIRLKQESDQHKDIIQGDFYEDYHNMTLKSLLGLKWVSQFCPSVKYVIKSDDDMIINLPHLLAVLSKTNMTRSILGPYNENSRVMRRGKWAIPMEVFPFYYYPAYESGAAYVISGDLVLPLFQTSHYVPSIFIDDVYITGILAKVLGARHVQIYGFSYWNSRRLKPCDIIANVMFTGTKMTPSALIDMWRILKVGKKCR